MHNLAAIVWLYRGQQERFFGLVKDYLGHVCAADARTLSRNFVVRRNELSQ